MLQQQRPQPVRQPKMFGQEPVQPVRLIFTATLLGFGFALGGVLFRTVADGFNRRQKRR